VADVVLPALNEAAAIPSVLGRLPSGFRPIVVDNASDDATAEVASACGATVVVEPQRGFGAACWRGLLEATDDVVCFMDCDASLDGADLPAVAEPVGSGEADLVLGARHPEAGAWPRHARLANRVLAFEVRRRTGVPVTDLGPMRAVGRAALLDLGVTDRRFGWPLEMVLRAAAADWRITEVEVRYSPRIGRSKVTGTVNGTVKAIRDMSRVARATT